MQLDINGAEQYWQGQKVVRSRVPGGREVGQQLVGRIYLIWLIIVHHLVANYAYDYCHMVFISLLFSFS